MLRNHKFYNTRLFEIAVLILVSALVYLPNIGKLTLYKDEWYFIHDASIAGPGVFINMFAIDRPARGLFFQIYYALFSYHALPYGIGAFVWRVIAIIGALWLFQLLWPRDRKVAFGATLLFAVYPGYLWWVSPIEYQPHIASLALEVFSIVFTLKAIQSGRPFVKAVYAVAAILTGWAYIALVDYAIGMEIFRFLCVFLLVRRELNPKAVSLWKTGIQTVRTWLLYGIIPVGILIWREFFFTNTRKATDASLQLGMLISSPGSTAVNWLIHLFQSVLNVGLFAWVSPFVDNFFDLHLRDIGIALFIMCIVILILVMKELLADKEEQVESGPDKALMSEALWLGLLGTTFGVLPVILANRYVIFQDYSHYALPASLAGVTLLIGLVNSIVFRRLRFGLMLGLVAVASLTHYAVSVNALTEEQAIQQFWWQMDWRVPGIKPGTTLIINYPTSNIGDDGNAVQEAADLLYYPESNPAIPVHYKISAASANNDNTKMVLVGHESKEFSYRSHTSTVDFGNVLILSQPSSGSCVHVIDPKWPVISVADPNNVLLLAPHSNIEDILADNTAPVPREAIYGPEPAQRWCFYYEKMDLAIQEDNWGQAAALGNKAVGLGLHPEDQSEWLPVLKVYAMQDDMNGIKTTIPKINANPFLRLEACQLLGNHENQSAYSPEVQLLLSQSFCRAGK
jgi:hypothetical protein